MADEIDKFATYLLDLGSEVQRHTEEFKAKITPHGSKEQWTAWDCLERAVANLHSAGVYVELHAEKEQAARNERAKRVQRSKERL